MRLTARQAGQPSTKRAAEEFLLEVEQQPNDIKCLEALGRQHPRCPPHLTSILILLLPVKGISNTHTRLSRRSRIQRNVAIQLGRLLIDLVLITISLRKCNLESQHLQLQFQHLVLDLAILEVCGVSAGGGDLVVEAPRADFGVFGNDTGVFEDLQIRVGDTSKVSLVDLLRTSQRRPDVACMKLVWGKRTGKFALTSSNALPATPSETWKSAYDLTVRTPAFLALAIGPAAERATMLRRTATLEKYILTVKSQ